MTFWQVRAGSGSTNIACFRCDKRIDQWATAAWSDVVDRYYHISCVPYGQEIRIAPDDYFGDPLAELKPTTPRVTGRDLLTTKIIETKQAVIRETGQAFNKMMSSDINVDLWGTNEVKEPIVIVAPPLPTTLEVYSKAAIDELLRPLVAPALLRVMLRVAGVGRVPVRKPKPVDKDDTIAKDGEARAALLELD